MLWNIRIDTCHRLMHNDFNEFLADASFQPFNALSAWCMITDSLSTDAWWLTCYRLIHEDFNSLSADAWWLRRFTCWWVITATRQWLIFLIFFFLLNSAIQVSMKHRVSGWYMMNSMRRWLICVDFNALVADAWWLQRVSGRCVMTSTS